MHVSDVMNALEELAPQHYAASFDNTGLLTGEHTLKVTGILITLDCLENIVDEAIHTNCNLIVTFHPIIFSGLKHLQPTDYVRKAVTKAIKNDIAIFAMHTALDVSKGGVSYRMAQELGLTDVKTLIPTPSIIKKLTTYIPVKNYNTVETALFEAGAGYLGNYSHASFNTSGTGSFKGDAQSNPVIGTVGKRETVDEKQLQISFLPHLEQKVLAALHNTHPYEQVSYEINTLENDYQDIGMGAIGTLPNSLEPGDFLKKTAKIFKTGIIRHTAIGVNKITKVALLGGSGAFAIKNALQSEADAYITADLKYHDFFGAKNMLLCDIGHYESEQFTKNLIHEFLSKKFSNFAILCAQAQTNPVNYF